MRPPQVNLQHIISFYYVAKEKSFSDAAEKLFVTQPAVTQQIRTLEIQFGVKLINIKKKRVYLTKAGERLFVYAEEFLDHAILVENFLKSYRSNNLYIGIAGTMMLYLMGMIDKFKELYPSVQVTVREGPSRILAEELLDFRHDICIVGPLSNLNERLNVFHIPPKVEQLVFVASPEYRLSIEPPLKWKELACHPLIIQPEGSVAYELIFNNFTSRGLKLQIGAEVDNIEFAKTLAKQKKGIALMFQPNIREELANGTLTIIPIEDGEIWLGIDVLTNKEAASSPVIEAFFNIIKDHFHYVLSKG
ncbi:MAG: LysR family transcriptional regulator [Proteobacteria bacterium]|nr:LysR family transcriptional regulator [Pseudomonadota bacterium]